MRLIRRTAIAVLLAVTALIIPASATAQPQVHGAVADIVPLGTVFSADVVRDLPLGDNVYALLETTQSEVISDRFNSGGLNVGGDSRAGGFLGSWSQTLFRIGDINVSDPLGRGSAMLFPDTTLWQNVNIATGLMPADINTPGLAVTLGSAACRRLWTRVFSGSGSGGGLAAAGPADQPNPDRSSGLVRARLCSVQRPVCRQRLSLVAAGTWAGGASYRREQLATTDDTTGSGFAHLVFAPSAGREWRVLAWVQRAQVAVRELAGIPGRVLVDDEHLRSRPVDIRTAIDGRCTVARVRRLHAARPYERSRFAHYSPRRTHHRRTATERSSSLRPTTRCGGFR